MRRRWVALALAPGVALAGCGEDGSVQVPWLAARPGPSPDSVSIGYESDPCTRARQAVVEQDDERVTVTLLDPDRDPQEFCILVTEPGCVIVPLEEPLSGRRVVDGARDRDPQRAADLRGLPFSRYGPCRRVPVEG